MAFNLALDVTTEQVRSQSQKIDTTVQEIRKLITIMRNSVEQTDGYWKGEAADMHRSELANSADELQAVLQRIANYPIDIQKMAGIYEGAEDTNEGLATQLQPDVQLV